VYIFNESKTLYNKCKINKCSQKVLNRHYLTVFIAILQIPSLSVQHGIAIVKILLLNVQPCIEILQISLLRIPMFSLQ
jgi:hypothetical protein